MEQIQPMFIVFLLLSTSNSVFSSNNALIPADKSQVNHWFNQNVGPLSSRKSTMYAALVMAESSPKTVKVRRDGKGDFTTITEAVNSIPPGNRNRVIVSIGPGRYREKITVDINKPFVTFYGDPNSMPTLVFDGTATKYGTVLSATLLVYSDYFVGVNLRVVNSAKRGAGQAVAMTIQGDMAAFYDCEFHGFQDTLCDNSGKHFYKDCYIEGTVDFIFGSGQSLFLNTTAHVIQGDQTTFITAQARGSSTKPNGYSLVHCTVTGTGRTAYLGRAWTRYGRVVFAYSKLSDVVNPEGWFNNREPKNNKTVYFGEYENTGPGSDLAKRVHFTKELSDTDAAPFLKLAFIKGSTWLLPPPKYS